MLRCFWVLCATGLLCPIASSYWTKRGQCTEAFASEPPSSRHCPGSLDKGCRSNQHFQPPRDRTNRLRILAMVGYCGPFFIYLRQLSRPVHWCWDALCEANSLTPVHWPFPIASGFPDAIGKASGTQNQNSATSKLATQAQVR